MRALQYTAIGQPPEILDIDRPTPAAGQVLLRVSAAGLCHSDAFIMGLSATDYVYGLPLTLGHEGVGTVAELGEGATGVRVGDVVAVYGPWGCGQCVPCSRGEENYCLRAAELGITPPGLGAPGAMAEYMLVDDPRHLVPIKGLDPVQVVSLTDAGLTPYHAIKQELDLLQPGSTAVVIGAGGLGHVAVQILRAICSTTVIALDISDEKLDLATKIGAHHVLRSDTEASAAIHELTDGVGADVVLDFVGSQATLEIARTSVRVNGSIVIVGIGGGLLPSGFFSTPFGVRVRNPYWGTRDELVEVLELARTGQIHVEVEKFGLDDGPKAYERLHAGTIRGRAVLVP
ncbi:NAD(P)-dependent alcohol dehydrogenase [Aeromicrobium sp.]|uniref:NAD(P)-dependent alcohol dehydrogenase n=1 Tax=Aeromicrobium sp. TaxID=1871063 RepID=UPI0019A73C57|nr:NAD(P)-dependent alcohol dehydrogenase [Aeromicrobium sp.]MBC7630616.1 NAD(P)-dependent alcohol dehydrogenase [Aeromicrobium sp.]